MQIPISINRQESRSLQLQIYEAIREMILRRLLRPGHRLPSTRSIAQQLQVSRNTVVLAYDKLLVEDYIVSRDKLGIFVSERIPDATVLVSGRDEVQRLPAVPQADMAGRVQWAAPRLWSPVKGRPRHDFFVGRPHADAFPVAFWRQSAQRHLLHSRPTLTEYGDPCGLARLRKSIAEHVSSARGVHAEPDQVIVTAGIQGALNLLARYFVDAERCRDIVIENPCYQGAAQLFSTYESRLHAIDVDDDGLIVSRLRDITGGLAYVTPSHQFPTGATLSLERRVNLITWARQTGSFIIEDDYDSDFTYDRPPLTALAGLDGLRQVIYLGTFSKSVGAGIRIGYAIVPRALAAPLAAAKALSDHGAPWLDQAVLADFLEEGAFLRHLKKIRRLYMASRDVLIAAIAEHFPGSTVAGHECGMHLMWTLPPGYPPASAIQQHGLSQGVGLYPLQQAAAYVHETGAALADRSFVMGYPALRPDEIREAIRRLRIAADAAGARR